MDSIEYDNSRRKSSCATVVPPQKQNRKLSIPLTINCKDNGRSVFYDTGSMTDMSPTTAVSSKRHLPIFPEEPQSTPFLCSLKSKILDVFSKKSSSKEERTISRATTQCEKANYQKEVIHVKHGNKKSENSSSSTLSKNIRQSYSDPRLSPGSTAVGCDDDEERQGYFGFSPAKKKKSPRGWVAAVLMIVVGALIAVTFVLVGLGKALGGNNTIASSPSVTPSSPLPSSETATSTIITTPAITTTMQSAAPIITFTVVSPSAYQTLHT